MAPVNLSTLTDGKLYNNISAISEAHRLFSQDTVDGNIIFGPSLKPGEDTFNDIMLVQTGRF